MCLTFLGITYISFWFKVCDVCQITINKTENNTFKAVELSCVLHDSRTFIRAPEVKQIFNIF